MANESDTSPEPEDHGPQCEIGRRLAAGQSVEEAWAGFHERERKCIERDGWFAHLVNGDPDYPLGANYHTHGLAECHNHTDLQLVVPIHPGAINTIFQTVIGKIRAGEKFKAGDVIPDVVNGYSIKFVDATECERPVLRIIIPDKDGNIDRETITGSLAQQYDDLE